MMNKVLDFMISKTGNSLFLSERLFLFLHNIILNFPIIYEHKY